MRPIPTHTRHLLLAAAAFAALSPLARAGYAPWSLYNTGTDANGVNLGVFASDSHYTLVNYPGYNPGAGNGYKQAVVVQAHPAWRPGLAGAQWLSDTLFTISLGSAPGDYVFRTTFNIPTTVDLSSVVISGSYATDNNASMLINGNSGPNSTSFSSDTPISIDYRKLRYGTNTIDFSVNNSGVGPMGLFSILNSAFSAPAARTSLWTNRNGGNVYSLGDWTNGVDPTNADPNAANDIVFALSSDYTLYSSYPVNVRNIVVKNDTVRYESAAGYDYKAVDIVLAPSVNDVSRFTIDTGTFPRNLNFYASTLTLNTANTGPIFTVQSGIHFNLSGAATINSGATANLNSATSSIGSIALAGTLNLTGGSLTTSSISGAGALNLSSATLSVTGAGGLNLGSGYPVSNIPSGSTVSVTNTATLPIGSTLTIGGTLNAGSVYNGGTMTVNGVISTGTLTANGTINISGGSVTATTLAGFGAPTTITSGGSLSLGTFADGPAIVLSNGTLSVTGAGGASIGSGFPIGTSGTLTLSANQALNVTNTATITSGSTVAVSGGTFSPGALAGTGSLTYTSGTLNLPTSTSLSSITLNGPLTAAAGKTITLTGNLNVNSGGSLALAGNLTAATVSIVPGGSLTLSGGTASAASFTGDGTFNLNSGTVNITGASGQTFGAGTPFVSPLTLSAGRTLNITNTATINSGRSITLSGGSLSAASITNNGTFTFTSGSLAINGASGLTHPGLLSSGFSLNAGGSLSVTNTLTLNGALNLNGGALQAASITGAGPLAFTGGNLTITGAAGLSIASPLSPTALSLASGTNLNVTNTLTVPSGASLSLTGGSVTAASISAASADISLTSGSLSANAITARNFTLGTSMNLDASQSLVVGVATTFNPGASLALTGGTFTTSALSGSPAIAFYSGVINVTGPSGAALGSDQPLGPGVNLTSGCNLNITNNLAINADSSLDLNGGTLSAASISGAGNLTYNSGTFTLPASLAVGSLNYSSLTVGSGKAIVVSGTTSIGTALTVAGGSLVTGSLQSQGPVSISSGTLDAITLSAPSLNISSGNPIIPAGRTWNISGTTTLVGNPMIIGGALTTGAFVSTGGTVNINSGGSLTAATYTGTQNFNLLSGSLTLTNSALVIGNSQLLGNSPTLSTGRNVSVSGVTTINAGASLTISGGSLTTADIINNGAFSFGSGTLNKGGNLTVGTGQLLGTFLPVGSNRKITIAGTTTINAGASLNVSGGFFSTGAIVKNGSFSFSSGTLALTASGLTFGTGQLLGANVTLGTGKVLQLAGDAYFNSGSVLTMDGGSLTANRITGDARGMVFNSGSITLTGADGTGQTLMLSPGGVLTDLTLPAAASFRAAGEVKLHYQSSLTLSGGTLTVGALDVTPTYYDINTNTVTPGGSLNLNTGTLTITNDRLYVGDPNIGLPDSLSIGTGLSVYAPAGTTISGFNGSVSINGGLFSTSSFAGDPFWGFGTFAFNSGTFEYTGGNYSIGSGILGNNVDLYAGRTLQTPYAATIDPGATLTLSGGALNTDSLVNNGTFNFNAGTLKITSPTGLSLIAGQALGTTPTLGSNRSLVVTNTLTIPAASSLTLAGGSLTAAALSIAGTLNFNTGALTLTGPAGLTLGTGQPLGASRTLAANQSLTTTFATTINPGSSLTLSGGSLTAASLVNNGTFSFASGTVALGASGLTGAGQCAVTGGTLTLPLLRQESLSITGGRLNLQSSAAARLTSLSIGLNGTLDLANTPLVIDYTGASPLQSVVTALNSGRNGYDANIITNWNGKGIISSKARTDSVAAGFDLYTIGLINNADLADGSIGRDTYTTFAGLTTDASSVLLRYTYSGDADLNGQVDGDDYALIDNAFNALIPNFGWLAGDFNYDTNIDGDDYALIDSGFLFQGAPIPAAATTAVPEPAALGVIALGAVGLLGRKRRSATR